MVISHSEVFLKVPMIIIMIFGENVLCPKYIDIYEFWGVLMKVHG